MGWERLIQGIGGYPDNIVNVKQYGAIGDGTTDDTTAIQNAINAVNSQGGGMVYFPQATYCLTSSLLVPTNITLQGNSLSILKWANPLTDSVRAGIQLQGDNTRVIGLTLDLNFQTTLNGITVLAHKFIIDKIRILNGYDYGIWVFEGLVGQNTVPLGNDVSGEGFITNCDVSARDCYEIYSGRKVTISNCISRGDATRATQPSSTGFYVWGRAQDLTIQGCHALGSYLTGAFTVAGKETSVPLPRNVDTHVTINGCHALLDSGDGIHINDASHIRGEGNFINITGTGYGIYIAQSDTTIGATHDISLGGTVATGSGLCVYVSAVTDVEFKGLNLSTVSNANLVDIGGNGKRCKFIGGTWRLGSNVGTASFFALAMNAYKGLTLEDVTFIGSANGYDLLTSPGNLDNLSIINCTFDGVRLNRLTSGINRIIVGNQFFDSANVIPISGTFYINASGADKYLICNNVAQLTANVTTFLYGDAGTTKVVANNLYS